MSNNNKLRVINFETEKEFEANGVKYFVEENISFARFDMMVACTIRLAYGRDFDSIHGAVTKALAHLDKVQFVQASVELNNIVQGMKKFPLGVNDAFAVCAFFINSENEDRTICTGEMIAKKIADWGAAGLDAFPFQILAAKLCGGFLKAWRELEGPTEKPIAEIKS